MKIALLHYHLKPGGVTTVLTQQAAAINAFGEVLVLTGEPTDAPLPFDAVFIPGLGYDTAETEKTPTPGEVAAAVETTIFSRWPNGCDVLHVHNPTLKKNRNFPAILKNLQRRGLTLFLQIHDFAEDGRPRVYSDEAYPADCHYGVINSRDETILRRAGLKKKGLHRIFNTVQRIDTAAQPMETEPYILYPVRALRRKNIGEAILLSLFFKDNQALWITLPPNSPSDLRPYGQWKDFVRTTGLNVVFEAGRAKDFSTLVHTADGMITTSITEGFGFCFLEPWTAGKFLWGRKLPDICHDFEANGISLHHLYPHFRVPLDWVGEKAFYEKWAACIRKSGRLFGLKPDPATIAGGFRQITPGKSIDFGLLDETFQEKVIICALSGKTKRQLLLRRNPHLSLPMEIPDRQTVIGRNRRAILATYNQQKYQETLKQIYTKVAAEPVRQRIDKQILLDRFFDLKTFSLLKWGTDAV